MQEDFNDTDEREVAWALIGWGMLLALAFIALHVEAP